MTLRQEPASQIPDEGKQQSQEDGSPQPPVSQKTFSFITWNSDGLQRHLYKDIFAYLHEHDIVSILETWAVDNKYDDLLTGFTGFSSYAIKTSSRGRASGGITVFVKDIWKLSVQRLCYTCRYAVVLLLNKAIFGLENDILAVFSYLPPEGSPSYNDQDEKNGVIILHELMQKVTADYPNAHIILSGDLNARIGEMKDYIPGDTLEHILANGDDWYESDDFDRVRNTKDVTVNDFGLELIRLCKTLSIHVVNGRVAGDENGEFTCVTPRGCSMVDYFIVSSCLFGSLSSL